MINPYEPKSILRTPINGTHRYYVSTWHSLYSSRRNIFTWCYNYLIWCFSTLQPFVIVALYCRSKPWRTVLCSWHSLHWFSLAWLRQVYLDKASFRMLTDSFWLWLTDSLTLAYVTVKLMLTWQTPVHQSVPVDSDLMFEISINSQCLSSLFDIK